MNFGSSSICIIQKYLFISISYLKSLALKLISLDSIGLTKIVSFSLVSMESTSWSKLKVQCTKYLIYLRVLL